MYVIKLNSLYIKEGGLKLSINWTKNLDEATVYTKEEAIELIKNEGFIYDKRNTHLIDVSMREACK